MKCWTAAAVAAALGISAVAAPVFTRNEEAVPSLKPLRAKVADRVLMYPEIQYKYGLFQNFLGGYIDRPLFFDRSTRYTDTFKYQTPESFYRDCEIRQMYGFDGGGSLCSHGGLFKSYVEALKFLEAAPERLKNYYEFPQFSYGESGVFKVEKENTARVIRTALKSPFTPKIKGRIPISTYNSQAINPDVMAAYLKSLKEEFGDTFAVTGIVNIDFDDSEKLRSGKYDEQLKKKYKEKIDRTLKIFDGIQLRVKERTRGRHYQTVPDFSVYDKIIKPLLLEALAKPENKNKLVCGAAQHGYVNHMSGVNFGEFGTATLRGCMDRFAEINCDFVFFFEWNEFNENTCWQPTLYNSLVLQRLVRFYANTMRDELPAPNKGDDLNIPPLALSHRETLKVGEVLQFELLNIPDSAESKEYEARLRLEDGNGKVLIEFPKEKFDRAELKAITYSVPTETVSAETVLLPKLTVTGLEDGKEIKFDNFQYVRLLPTFCYNYKSVRQSLRDLLRPEAVEFKVKALGHGKYELIGKIDSKDELASLEVTDFGREVYALDPANEFDREKNVILVGSFITRSSGIRPLQINVKDGGNWNFRPWEFPNVKFGDYDKYSDSVDASALIWSARSHFIISIPKVNADKAEIEFAVDDTSYTIKVADLLKEQMAAHQFPRCRLEIQEYHALCDIPVQLKSKSGEFKSVISSERPYPIYQLRAVTVNGKIYRSEPQMPRKLPEKREPLNVYSETTGKVITVPVVSALVPRLAWKIRQGAGALLNDNGFDPFFRCDLGGGYDYGSVFNTQPVPAGNHVPGFVTEGDTAVLEFDGNSYLHFPKESFPRGVFKLRMDIKPEPGDAVSYVLFRHYDRILGSVTVFVKYDKLCFAMAGRDLETSSFTSNLTVAPGKWSDVEIGYDLHKVTLKVNGKEQSFPLEAKLALYFKPSIFGGHTKAEFGLPRNAKMFKGKLRAISIDHNNL